MARNENTMGSGLAVFWPSYQRRPVVTGGYHKKRAGMGMNCGVGISQQRCASYCM